MLISSRALIPFQILASALFCVVSAGCGSGGSSGDLNDSGAGALGGSLRVGAHYYLWYPRNFSQGFLRARLSPPQEPALGIYSSESARVAEQHIEWASSYGVDFFTLDWWPSRPGQNSAIDQGFLRAGNISKIKFCIFYETIDLGFDSGSATVFIDEGKRRRFVSDMKSIAERYFNHPSYLKIGDRPVIFLYVTRSLAGDYRGALEQARRELETLGYNPFLIGDEIYWHAAHNTATGGVLLEEPNVDRISLFDAITAYNSYAPAFLNHAGYASESQHLADTAALYERYRAASNVPIIPGVLAGYNDRGHRPGLDHYVIPRRFSAGVIGEGGQGTLLREYIRRIGQPYADGELNMITVTSWNEWNEDTAIEPIAPIGESQADSSGGRFTQGFEYGGTGFEALEVIAEISK